MEWPPRSVHMMYKPHRSDVVVNSERPLHHTYVDTLYICTTASMDSMQHAYSLIMYYLSSIIAWQDEICRHFARLCECECYINNFVCSGFGDIALIFRNN